MPTPNAFVTLVSSDSYLPGALAQVAALRDVHPRPAVPPELDFHTVCLVTPESLDVATIKCLRSAFDLVVGVEILEQDNPAGLSLLGRPDLTTVLTKLHVFRLAQFKKIIFLDADVLPIRPMSHLFSLSHEFSAAPDVGWPDIFNSGVLVLTPGQDKFDQLNQLIATKPSWDGGDQGLLNEWRGGDWNRLSFTYNTTPTAAYTYAPAYERYGSQIKAIHFIGPNKPWKNIPYRTPGRQPTSSVDSLHTAYDYDSLVDRWFDVYDRHYNAPSSPKSPFKVKRYTAAWESSAEPQISPAPLGLDELKRLAIQGINASHEDSRPGEGAYKSMPLEGRVDLMRPRKQEEPTPPVNPQTEIRLRPSLDAYIQETDHSDRFPSEFFNYDEILSTPIARRASLGVTDEPRWRTLPTPGPHEIPPSPRLRLVSLPPTPSPFAPLPTTAPDFYASESEAESFLLAHSDSAHENRPDSRHHHHHHHSTAHEHREQQHQQYFPPAQEHHDSEERHHHHHHHHDEQRQQQQHHEIPKRPASPPMMSWNPAVEPPPNVPPAPNAFPSDTYFANVWDHTPSRHNDQTPSGPSPPDSGGFFQPPPPPVIPDSLIRQGHYRNVTGDIHSGATPSPDKNKVKTIFPWEEKPRVLPKRVFPDSDAPPPSLFLSPGSQSQTSTTTPSTPETRGPTRAAPLSPLYGLPTAFSYANAWDNIPSIQKYASMLVKPPQPPAPLAPAFEDDAYRKSRRKSWDERAEVSSRDGDDEDNADDEDDDDGHVVSTGHKWDDDDSDGESAKRRSRRGSVVTASSLLGTKKKEYRTWGVQTIIVEKRSQGVQVDSPRPELAKHLKRGSASNRKHWAPATASTVVAPMTTTRDVSIGLPVNTLPEQPRRKSPSVSPTFSPLRSTREFVVLPSNSRSIAASPPPPPPQSIPPAKSGTVTPNARLMANHRPPPVLQPSGKPAAVSMARSSSAPQTGNARPPAQAPPTRPGNGSTRQVSPPVKPTIRTSNSSSSTLVLTPESPALHSAPPTTMPVQGYIRPTSSSRTSPTPVARRPSNDSSLGSPASSAGPLSPPDGHALLPPPPSRKGTRVWDPARGVDLFKRGSEDVIARFLKMGAWEEETR